LRTSKDVENGVAAHAASSFGIASPVASELLSAPAHDLWPRESILHVRGADCIGCYYIPRSSARGGGGLSLGLEYYVRVTASNARGKSPLAPSAASVVPNSVPNSPDAASLAIISGHELEVSWCPPALSADDISMYVVQWDLVRDFSNATAHPYVGCEGGRQGYGTCSVTGSAITGPCPYSFVIRGLATGVNYYVRLAGKNSVASQVVAGVDNTKWSGIMRAAPTFIPPSPPRSVVAVVLDGHNMQVQISPPVLDGGKNITRYEVDVDTDLSFQSSVARTWVFPTSTIPTLGKEFGDGILVVQVSDLVPGTYYYLRARAVTSIGDSLNTPCENHPIAPTQEAEAPSNATALPVPPTGDAPSTEIAVQWAEPPMSPGGDGGTAIAGYLVEWWEAHSVVEEVQAIRLSWPSNNAPKSTKTWTLWYEGEATNGMRPDVSAANVRDSLLNLHGNGAGRAANRSGFLFGPVDVTRDTMSGASGYVYSVTFLDDSGGSGVGGKNDGDLPTLPVQDLFGSRGSSSTYQVVSGVRAGGYTEIQAITSYGTGEGKRGSVNCDDSVIRGFWRLSFAGSAFSAYLSTEANASSVEAALESLPTVGDVSVSREPFNTTLGGSNGYRWMVTFYTPVGNLASIILDTEYVYSTNGDAGITVEDGNNAVSTYGVLLCDGCAPGEKAVGYGSALLDPDSRSYLIQQLTAGTAYKVTVSAVNKHGQRVRRAANSGVDVIPPVVVPGLPRGVALSVNYGSDDTLIASYQPPLSDGGAIITHYRVELDPATTSDYRDPTTTFQSPISQSYMCPALPTYAVWTVSTSLTNGTIHSGYFALRLTRSGVDLITDPIPFNAPALASEEIPHKDIYMSKTYCENYEDENLAYCPTSRLLTSGSMQSKMNALESLSEGVTVSRRTLANNAYVWSITFMDAGDDFELAAANTGLDGSVSAIQVKNGIHTSTLTAEQALTLDKVQTGVVHGACVGSLVMPSVGGLVTGQYYYGRVFAYNQAGYGEAQTALTPEKPMVVPGRPTGVVLEVYDATSLKVIFNPPTDDGGDAVDSYLVQYSTDPTFSSNVGNVSVVMLSAGAPFYRVMPNLFTGVDYYVRVLAHNSQGYGLPQSSSPTYEHPYVEPSPPTSVKIGVTSDTMLTVGFDYPASDGGDNVTQFKIEWDTAPSFASLSTSPDRGYAVVSASTERSYTIEYLTTYKTYYVRVSALNSAGWGQPRVADPASAVPSLQVPGQPVALAASSGTHDGYINIRWNSPRVPRHGIPCGGTLSHPARCPTPVGATDDAADGGAEITSYLVEWSIDPSFSAAQFDAGSQQVVDATAYTARNLTYGLRYYTRVAAWNIMGFSAFCAHTGNTCLGDSLASALTSNSTSTFNV